MSISYTFSQSVGSYTPISGGTLLGTATSANTIDDTTFAVSLPFTFNYDNTAQTAINVSSNGFISFGATAPGTTNYAPLSSTTAYAGAIAPFGRDLQGGYVTTGDRTLGSDQWTNISNIGPMQVGDVITGTGIAAGTTILGIAGNTVTMSIAATANSVGTAVSAFGPWSEIRYETLGSAPNRVFVVQWSGWKRYGTTTTTVKDMTLNFQVRLDEATGVIDVVYGNCTPGITTYTTTNQVGLRGATNAFPANINNRLNTKGVNDDWSLSAVGTANTSGMLLNSVAPANVIPNGLDYKWTPALVASNVSHGPGCYAVFDSFYQNFATAAAASAALNGTSLQMTYIGTGYVVSNGSATYVPPSGGATVFALGDDAEIDTPALTTALPIIGGSTGMLRVCSNGFVSAGAGNGTGFTPTVSTMLSNPTTGWYTWHDYNPGATGSGSVKFEEIGSVAYVTWDGVYNYLGTTAADASFIQYQFDESTGNVAIVFNSVSVNGGTGYLVGYSSAGANNDPGSMNFATGLPIVTGTDLLPLTLSASPRPVLGSTLVYTVSNIPAAATISALLISLAPASVELSGLGAPGCFQNVDLGLAATNLLFGSPSATYSMTLPTDLSFVGLPLESQAASLVPGVNPLGVLTSNGLRSTLSNL